MVMLEIDGGGESTDFRQVRDISAEFEQLTVTDDTSSQNGHEMHDILKPADTSAVQTKSKLAKVLFKLKKMASMKSFRYAPVQLTPNDRDVVGSLQRDRAVSSLRSLHRFYAFSPETFSSAVSHLDRLLSKVKVKTRYLSCIAAACYFLSSKVHEEPEDVPEATDLANLHRNTWKASDLKRMELVILDKLNWDMMPASCVTFLNVFYTVLCPFQPLLDADFFDSLVSTFEVCINYSSCAVFVPSALALCITRCCLDSAGHLSPFMNYCLLQLQTICQVSDSELLDCQCAMTRHLEEYSSQPDKHPHCLPLPKPKLRISLVSRPSMYGESDLPTIYEDNADMINTLNSDKPEALQLQQKLPQGYNRTNDKWSCLLQETCIQFNVINNVYTNQMCNMSKS